MNWKSRLLLGVLTALAMLLAKPRPHTPLPRGNAPAERKKHYLFGAISPDRRRLGDLTGCCSS